MAVEIIFYALVALVLHWRGAAALPALAWSLGAYSAAYWIVRVASLKFAGSPDALLGPLTGFPGHLLLMKDGCFFALGMLIWQLTRRPAERCWPGIMCFATVSLVAVWSRASAPPGHGGSVIREVALVVWAVAAMLIIVSVLWNGRVEVALRQWRIPARTLGLMTYPLYLLHLELGMGVMTALLPLGTWIAFVGAFTASCVLALAVLPAEAIVRRYAFSEAATSRTKIAAAA